MTELDPRTIWIVIAGMAIGSFVLRFVFIGLVGNRQMSAWLLRHLRYTAVALLPALVTPVLIWPDGPASEPEPARIVAVLITLAVGYFSRNVIAAVLSGAGALLLLSALFGAASG
ncbi:MAG: AzlD domain-containing protein [Pseudomonadota bacterium]